MNRREFARIAGIAAGGFAISGPSLVHALTQSERERALNAIERLRGEPPARAEVRLERGGPRLYLNRKEIYPFMASCTELYPTIHNFEAAGIRMIHPIVGLLPQWLGPGRYDWSTVDTYLGRLLELYPEAFFLPRIHLNTPDWWKDAHPDELIRYGLETPEDRYDIVRKRNLPLSEGGFYYRSNQELREASFASEEWRSDTAEMLRAFLVHMESSALVSRIIGYHPTWGTTSEWNYFGEDFLPDYSDPMKNAVGPIPDAQERMNSEYGLLRDPAKEAQVIRFYRKFHEEIAETVIRMAKVVKDATGRRILCGVFYGYVTENPRIQEGGYQAAAKVIESPDIDYIASPYCYQPGNAVDERGIRVTMVDGAGNKLGHPRGVGGDGGYRVPVESLRRRGKLFISEMDPSTYRDSSAYDVIGGHGGLGSDTVEGSLKILRRDIGSVFANGVGGWLLDFGPLNKAPQGWYSGKTIVGEIKHLVDLGNGRGNLDIASEAEICTAYDLDSFHATAHWKAGYPWTNYGIKSTDYFNHWFLDTQSRALLRMGAPMDELYRFDFSAADAHRYRLVFMPNAYLLDPQEAERLRTAFRDSCTTVVWFYAPGFMTWDRLDPGQMERLTGFRFTILDSPGTMLVNSEIHAKQGPHKQSFGVDEDHFPRFVVREGADEVFGEWADGKGAAFAMREYEGHTSVYVGTAPVPAGILRILAQRAGTHLWSDKPDIIRATRGTAMIVATDAGKRTLTLPRPMAPVSGGDALSQHALDMGYGDVQLFAVT
jgi:beta-galactosidase